jgi:hypothetical protein
LVSVKSRLSRFYEGAETVVRKFNKRRVELDRATIKNSETLTNMQDYLAQRTEVAQSKLQKMLHARRIANGDNSRTNYFADDFVTI